MPKLATGKQGSWFATVNGTREELPCVFKEYCQTGPTSFEYSDPYFYDQVKPRNRDYINAIANGKRVLLTSNTREGFRQDGGNKWKRGSYIGVFEIANVVCDENGLRFTFMSRVR
jgi:hypothetical protein